MQDKQQNLAEEAIDLKDCLAAIVKRRKIILFLFFTTLAITAVVSFLSPKVYKATTSIMITASSKLDTFSPSKNLPDMGKNNSANISLVTHKTLLKSNLILDRIVRHLNSNHSSARTVNLDKFLKKLNVVIIPGTNVIQLEATDATPQGAKEIADAWVQAYVAYSQELILGEVEGVREFVTSQYEFALQNLTEAEKKVNDFKKKYNLDLLKEELAEKKKQLISYRAERGGMELALKTKADSLVELKKQIATQEKFIIVSKAISDDILWQESYRKNNPSGIDKNKLRSEVINPIYQDLETRIVNLEIEINTPKPRLEYLDKSIEFLTKDVKAMGNDIIQKEFDLDYLMREVEIYRNTYMAFSNKLEEARIGKEAQLGDVRIVSPAIAPSHPAERGTLSKVAFAGIFSLITGVLLVFILEFWKLK